MPQASNFSQRLAELFADKKRRKLLLFLTPLVIGVFWVGSNFLASADEGAATKSVKVKRGPVTIKIIESGELRAQDQVTISAVTDKQILWLAPEGKWVQKGDTLVRFESTKYEIALDEIQSMVMLANAGYTRATNELEAQQMQESAAKKNFETILSLAKKGFITDGDVEKTRLGFIETKSRTRALEGAVRAAQANVTRAHQAYAQQSRKLRMSVILAPRDGLVVYATVGDEEHRKKISVGMTPLEGADLIYLPDVSSMLVDLQVSEVDLAKLRIGLPAEIRLDAYPDAVFKGEITMIADLAKRKLNLMTGKASGAKVFDVTLRVHESDLRLKPGLTATADIVLNQYDDVLYVPVESIFFDADKKPLVYLRQGSKNTPRHVSIGESNDRYVVIKDGLQEGDEILQARPKT